MTTSSTTTDGRRVMRRCPHCRLLFEALEGADACVVCGAAVDGLALPISSDAVPNEFVERETTIRLVPRDST
ncbi:MAG TPA: hypothetical protein VHB97_00415 [Polyangia bacterium]|jgi:hypothetical protein|nr:hypothetical protein [Polyangia bacterium]